MGKLRSNIIVSFMYQANCYAALTEIPEYINREEVRCEELLKNYVEQNMTENTCPPEFDGIYCWPSTFTSTLAEIQCPLPELKNETITRWCSTNITEISGSDQLVFEWNPAQYTMCNLDLYYVVYLLIFIFQDPEKNFDYLNWWYNKCSIIEPLGSALSIISLAIALCIFTVFTQLQDTRVKVHMNLFIAMLLQSLMSLTQNFIYGCQIYYTIILNDLFKEETSQFCRALMTLSQYFELAIFTWLMVEGWHFYSYTSRAPYKQYVTIIPHVLAGWGMPLTVIIPWIIVHLYTTETNFCWVDTDIKTYIVAIPIFIMVLMNLCFFMLNVKILFTKIKSTYTLDKRMDYWRWIKSTLMLVPLFGAYDVLYGIWPWIDDREAKNCFLLLVRLICSFQGCIVATLYCFLNAGVKQEIGRAWNTWKIKRKFQSEISKYRKKDAVNEILSNSLNKITTKSKSNNLDFINHL